MNDLSTCSHFGQCSGCTLSSLPPILSHIKEFLNPFPLEIGPSTHWRVKAKLAVRAPSSIGLFRAHSHQVIPIPHCKTHHPSINRAVSLLQEALLATSFSLYQESTNQGALRYIQLFVDLATQKVQLVLILAHHTPTDALCKALLQHDLWHSIYLNIQPQTTNRILGDQWIHLYGPTHLTQLLHNHPIAFHPGAFAQANWSLFSHLASDLLEWIPPGSYLLEVYAGVGALGLLAAPKCHSVHLIENNPHAHTSFLAMNHLHIAYTCQDATHAITHLHSATTLLVDPPRKGLDPTLLRAIQTWSGDLFYISCDFHSFQRDATQLLAAGWSIQKAKGYLFFPGTNHIEILTHFKR